MSSVDTETVTLHGNHAAVDRLSVLLMNAANIEVVGREKYARPTVWSRDVSPTNQFADNRFADKTFH